MIFVVAYFFILQLADDMNVFKKIYLVSDCWNLHHDVELIFLTYDANRLAETLNDNANIMYLYYELNCRNLCHVFDIGLFGVFFD